MPLQHKKGKLSKAHRPSLAQKHEKAWHMGRVITSMDAFSSPVPQFNINGETKVRTLCGGLTSFFIFIAALAYAAGNSLELVSPRSP